MPADPGLPTPDREAMRKAAMRRDAKWQSDPPVNHSLYYEGYTDGYRAALASLAGQIEQLRAQQEADGLAADYEDKPAASPEPRVVPQPESEDR